MEGSFLTDTRMSKFEQIIKFAREGKNSRRKIGDYTYQLIARLSEPPIEIQGKRFVFIGIEQLRKGQKRLFHCSVCSYSLRDGLGSVCIKDLGKSTLRTVYCGKLGHEPVFYVEKK